MSAKGYDVSSITVLEGLDAVRKRPGMYIGSTDARGLHHLLAEIVDNSVDEAAAGYASAIEVTLHPDGSAEVVDSGRGIPVDIDKHTKLSGVELVMTKLHAGGKFSSGSYAAAGGLHGVGASVVNALSVRLDATVWRNGAEHRLSFAHGVAGHFSAKGRFSASSKLDVRPARAKGRTGTGVRFWPDPAIFGTDTHFDADEVAQRLERIAFLVPGVKIGFTDARSGRSETYRSKLGLADMATWLSHAEGVCDVATLRGEGSFLETVPVLTDGKLVSTELERRCEVEIALRWVAGWDTTVISYVNTIPTPHGGTHVAGFSRALTTVVNEALRDAKVLKAKEDNVTGDDCQEGLVAVVRVVLPEPQFEGQTKSALGTSAAQSIVYKVTADGLRAWFAGVGKKRQTRAVLDKIANASRARVAARIQRDTARRKNALESTSLPAKLADCRSKDVTRTELLICEGDSASGPLKAGRDSEIQAVLPLRGKILNTLKASPKDALANAECQAIFSAIGGGIGKDFDLDQVRYGRIVLVTDADVDGSHIRCLLLTLFYTYCRPLLDAGRVFAAMPPLYAVRPAAAKADPIYCYSDAERDAVLAALAAKGRAVRAVSRFKGLGEMDVPELAESVTSPETRTLRRITLDDAAAAAHMFDLCMGDAVEPRRNFIIAESAQLGLEDLDV